MALLEFLVTFMIFGVMMMGGLFLLVIVAICIIADIEEEEKMSRAYMREKISSRWNAN